DERNALSSISIKNGGDNSGGLLRATASGIGTSICLGAAGVDSPGDVVRPALRSSLPGDTAGVCVANGVPDAAPVGGPIVDFTAGGEAAVVGGAFTSCGVSAGDELAATCCGGGRWAPLRPCPRPTPPGPAPGGAASPRSRRAP